MKNKKERVKVRKNWNIDPTTKVHKDQKKDYNRAQNKREWAEEIEDELEDLSDIDL